MKYKSSQIFTISIVGGVNLSKLAVNFKADQSNLNTSSASFLIFFYNKHSFKSYYSLDHIECNNNDLNQTKEEDGSVREFSPTLKGEVPINFTADLLFCLFEFR